MKNFILCVAAATILAGCQAHKQEPKKEPKKEPMMQPAQGCSTGGCMNAVKKAQQRQRIRPVMKSQLR